MRRIGTLLCVFIWATNSCALNYIFDEFLFSKDTWPDWKLENPLADMNPSDFLPKAKESFPGYDQSEYNSLDGPRRRLPPGQKRTSSGVVPDVDPLDDENLAEPAAKAAQCTTCHVLVAEVWQRLTAQLLSGEAVTRAAVKEHLEDACEKEALDVMLRKYTLLKMESSSGGLPGAAITFFVVRERRDNRDRDGSGGSKGSGATEAEEIAVELSCKMLVEEYGNDLTSVLMTQLGNYRREALRLLVKHERDGGNSEAETEPETDSDDESTAAATTATTAASSSSSISSSSGSASGSGSGSKGQLPRLDGGGRGSADDDDDDEYVDPDDLDEEGLVKVPEGPRGRWGSSSRTARGPVKADTAAATASQPPSSGPGRVRGLIIKAMVGEPDCEDLNPLCGSWAVAGECGNNPNYMIGTDKHRGQCRKSCGVCRPDDVLSSVPELAAELDSVSSALMLAVKNLGCGAGGPCLSGVSGMALGSGLLKQQQQQQGGEKAVGGGRTELPPGMKEFPGGFILGKPWWARPEVQLVPPSKRKALAPPPDAGSGAEGPEGGSSGSGSGSGTLTPPSHGDVDRVLVPALAHRLLSIPSDFFIYEYMYKNHTRHYHMDRDGHVTEDWLLGRFTRESVSLMSYSTGEVAGLEELDLLPGSSHGQLLKVHIWPYVKQVYAGGDECVLGGGRRVVRRVEARIACSPDDHLYMLIREPDFCTYIFVIYVPQLCELDYYKPRPKAQHANGNTNGAGAGDSEGAGGGADGAGEGVRKRRRMAGGGGKA